MLFFLALRFRKAENDLSETMIQDCVMDGCGLLCLSIFHSFLLCHSLCSFSARKAIISITLHISAKFTVSVRAWPKGRKSHSVGVEFHFPACTYCVFIICSWFGITARYYFTGVPHIARRGGDCCYWNFDYDKNVCTCVSPEIAGWLWRCIFWYAFKLHNNGSSTVDAPGIQKKIPTSTQSQ